MSERFEILQTQFWINMGSVNKMLLTMSLFALMGVGFVSQAEANDASVPLDLSIHGGQVKRKELGTETNFSKFQITIGSSVDSSGDDRGPKRELLPFEIKFTFNTKSDQTENLTEYKVMAIQWTNEILKAAALGLAKRDLGNGLFSDQQLVIGNLILGGGVGNNIAQIYLTGEMELNVSSVKATGANETMAKALREVGENSVDAKPRMNFDLGMAVGLRSRLSPNLKVAIEQYAKVLDRRGDLTAGSSSGKYTLIDATTGLALKAIWKNDNCAIGVRRSTLDQDINFKRGQEKSSRHETEKYVECSVHW